MLNVSKLNELDLPAIDVRTLTGPEWEAVKREVERRARQERANMVRAMALWLQSWWRNRRQSRDPAAQVYAPADKQRLSFQGRL